MSSADVLGCLWSVVFQNKISRYIEYVVQSSSWSGLNFINDNKTLYLNNLLTIIKWNILAHRHQAFNKYVVYFQDNHFGFQSKKEIIDEICLKNQEIYEV